MVPNDTPLLAMSMREGTRPRPGAENHQPPRWLAKERLDKAIGLG